MRIMTAQELNTTLGIPCGNRLLVNHEAERATLYIGSHPALVPYESACELINDITNLKNTTLEYWTENDLTILAKKA